MKKVFSQRRRNRLFRMFLAALLQIILLSHTQCTNEYQTQSKNEGNGASDDSICSGYVDEIFQSNENEDIEQGISSCDAFFEAECPEESLMLVEAFCVDFYQQGLLALANTAIDVSSEEILLPDFYERLFYFPKLNAFHGTYFDTYAGILRQAVEDQPEYTDEFCQAIKDQSQQLQLTNERTAPLRVESDPQIKDQLTDGVWNAYMQYSMCELNQLETVLAAGKDCDLALEAYRNIPDQYAYRAFPIDFEEYQQGIEECYADEIHAALGEKEYMNAFYKLAILDATFYEEDGAFIYQTIKEVTSGLSEDFMGLSETYQCQLINEIKAEYRDAFTLNGEYANIESTAAKNQILSFIDDEIGACYLRQVQNQHENGLCTDARDSINALRNQIEEDEFTALRTANLQCFWNEMATIVDGGDCDDAISLYQQVLNDYGAVVTEAQKQGFDNLGVCQAQLVKSMVEDYDAGGFDLFLQMMSDFENGTGPFAEQPAEIEQLVNEITQLFAQKFLYFPAEFDAIYTKWLAVNPDSALSNQGEDFINREDKELPVFVILPSQIEKEFIFQFDAALETPLTISKPNSPDADWFYEEIASSNPFSTDLRLVDIYVEFTEDSSKKEYTEVEYTFEFLPRQIYPPNLYLVSFRFTLYINQGYGEQEIETQKVMFYLWVIED